MKSSHNVNFSTPEIREGKRIIRGAEVEGIMFCAPDGALGKNEPEDANEKEKKNLQALEAFWHGKGLKEGQEKGHEDGLAEGHESGYQKGLLEGKAEGEKTGKESARDEALQEGYDKAKEEFAESTSLIEKISEELRQKQEEHIASFKPELIKLSLIAVELILKRELERPEVLTEIIEKMVSQAASVIKDNPAHCFLNPDDYAALKGNLETLGKEKFNIEHFSLLEDHSLERGNCRLETNLGMLNFDVKRYVRELQEEIFSG